MRYCINTFVARTVPEWSSKCISNARPQVDGLVQTGNETHRACPLRVAQATEAAKLGNGSLSTPLRCDVRVGGAPKGVGSLATLDPPAVGRTTLPTPPPGRDVRRTPGTYAARDEWFRRISSASKRSVTGSPIPMGGGASAWISHSRTADLPATVGPALEHRMMATIRHGPKSIPRNCRISKSAAGRRVREVQDASPDGGVGAGRSDRPRDSGVRSLPDPS